MRAGSSVAFIWSVSVGSFIAANEKTPKNYVRVNVYWHFEIIGCHCLRSPTSSIQIPSSQAISLSSLLILSSHIFFSKDYAFEGVSISKSFLFISSESHVHSYYLDFTSITKHVTCLSDNVMDWIVKIIHLLNSLSLMYFSECAFYWCTLRSSPKVKDHLTRLQKTTETITVRLVFFDNYFVNI
jgi:hypothetical protein